MGILLSTIKNVEIVNQSKTHTLYVFPKNAKILGDSHNGINECSKLLVT